MKKYDVMIVGPVSLDHNIDCEGRERRELGGAVVASGFAAARSGRRTAVFTKFNPGTADAEPAFAGSGAEVYWKASASTCAIRNQYFTQDKEKRSCTAVGRCDGFFFDELPRVETSVYHFAGLMTGDIDERMIAEAAGYGKVAVDVQGFLRCAGEDGAMTFRDWENKRLYLPHIDYLKTDAAEAEILTGVSDRRQAARILHRWGASEVLITHNTEVLAFDGSQMRTCPIRARNLSGRTGRGDTAFAGYITERQYGSLSQALLYCTALVSLKMESAGPFRGTREDVLEYVREFYPEYCGQV